MLLTCAGDFVNDLNDDVADFEPEACQGLVGWRDFYFKVRVLRNVHSSVEWAGQALRSQERML
jgi:hypothetical protein